MEKKIERLEEVATAVGAVEVAPARTATCEEVAARIDEGFALLIGCALHFAALAEEGLTEAETRRFRALLEALRTADAVLSEASFRKDAISGRAETVRARLYDAVGDAAGRLRARAAFAFRHDRGGARLRAFAAAYAPRLPGRGAAMRDAVELKLR
jgi:hypothetical protein